LSGKFIKLTADISLSGFSTGAGWTPIGNYSTSSIVFAGNFDGAGFTVSNLYINIPSATAAVYAGLFGYVSAGTIQNLGVSGSVSATTSGGANYIAGCVGGITGYAAGRITSCYNTASVSMISTSSAYDYMAGNVGGIAGATAVNVTMCYNAGMINLSSNYRTHAGGIVGDIKATAITIEGCYNTGEVSTNSSASIGGVESAAGGIVAYVDVSNTTIKNCYNAAAVTATGGGECVCWRHSRGCNKWFGWPFCGSRKQLLQYKQIFGRGVRRPWQRHPTELHGGSDHGGDDGSRRADVDVRSELGERVYKAGKRGQLVLSGACGFL
jgi:hypothetical protein